jgi:hypothetical protein
LVWVLVDGIVYTSSNRLALPHLRTTHAGMQAVEQPGAITDELLALAPHGAAADPAAPPR